MKSILEHSNLYDSKQNSSSVADLVLVAYDLSIGSPETKYIKLNTKTQNIFCCLNENLTTFFILRQGGQENIRRKKFSLLKCIHTKVECSYFSI